MTGRGIDQVLPHPSDPRLYESAIQNALDYVRLAERVNGAIPRRVDFAYIWGDALDELDELAPDVRIINLETSITESSTPMPKGINYRMHPKNVPCITEARIDCCVLANNHLLDWGRAGLLETLTLLHAAGLQTAGAGRNLSEAQAPALLPAGSKGRVLVYAFGTESSGIPPSWAAGPATPGVHLLRDFSSETVAEIAAMVGRGRQPGDVVVGSIHWGSNWGYDIPAEHRDFAHALIDNAGIDIVHGHSSHHAKGIEVYRDKLILYGCGDFLNDYEGIGHHRQYRDDLPVMYFVSLEPTTGKIARVQMTPLHIRRFRLHRASSEDAGWVSRTLSRVSQELGTRIELTSDDTLELVWN
jgi:poly-gamma-glutamate capsule biosynthesis protein CapA/YwtB (metallophosphatase superfamily)